MGRYRKVKEGEWVMPIMKDYKMACCDCGLVHKVTFMIVEEPTGNEKIVDFDALKEIKNTRVMLIAERDERATKNIRKSKKPQIEI